MLRHIPFHFHVQANCFTKADAPEGKRKRIGGIISTETPDRQGEVVLQSGLEFGEFLGSGWFNDNHSKETTDIVGYPEQVKRFAKGDPLPDGRQAKANGTWVEGYLLETKKAQEIWELGQALKGTDRRLGFSVEGKVEQRDGPKTVYMKGEDGEGQWVGRNIIKAVVRNVAITNAPVQTDSRLEILAKSLAVLNKENSDEEDEEEAKKALAMGPATPGVKPAGPKTGVGAGQVLGRQHMERTEHDLIKEKKLGKSLTTEEAIRFVQTQVGFSHADALRFVNLSRVWKNSGRL